LFQHIFRKPSSSKRGSAAKEAPNVFLS
jgi:hypothetical protein